jgi:hypothetical protein
MRIIWNPAETRFEAELTPGPMWVSDKDSVSQAGFRCTGPPGWTWFCTKSSILSGLQQCRPQSGLTITPEALERYKALRIVEDANAAVKAQLETARKALKKEQKFQAEIEQPTAAETEHGEFDYLRIESGESRIWTQQYAPPAPPAMLCRLCQTPIYFYECQEPPTCLDCEFPENKP